MFKTAIDPAACRHWNTCASIVQWKQYHSDWQMEPATVDQYVRYLTFDVIRFQSVRGVIVE